MSRLVVYVAWSIPAALLLWSACRHVRAERYDLALRGFNRLPARFWRDPTTHPLHRLVAECYRHLGRNEEARRAEATARELETRYEKLRAKGNRQRQP